ncbi:MAG TPA: hypothetical protein VFO85_21935, partial [Vicinamibacteria bacterium]|nr:hypothetical protein [Vicinamibacteria bacterium]
DAWRIVVGHHPGWSPRGCAFRVLGTCFGGHGDDEAVQRAMFPVFERQRPDLVIGAHNHFYARSRALDGSGYPAVGEAPGVRHFVSGGGGGPLYRVQPLHSRYASAGAYHHFLYLRLRGEEAFFWTIDERGLARDWGCFRRGENADRCITRGSYDSDELECGVEPAPAGGCPDALATASSGRGVGRRP